MNLLGRLRNLLPARQSASTPIAQSKPQLSRLEQEASKFYERADRRNSPTRFERIKNRTADIAGKAWFLPYHDSITGETEGMRATYDKMLASPFVKAGILYKVSAVAALDWQIQPQRPDDPRDREGCEFLRHSIERTPEGMPGIIRAALLPKLIKGFSVAEKVVEVERNEPKWNGKVTLAAVKPKSHKLFDLEVDAFNNVVGIRGKGVNAGECWPIRDFIYTRHLSIYDEPYGMSDLRAAYGEYWMLDTVSKLRAIHAEKKTSPFLLGEYAEDDDKASLETALALAKTTTWMTVPEGVKVQALNLAGQGEGDFKSFCDDKQKGILIAILGAYLQVLEGQVPNGRGNASVSKGVTELLIWLLASEAQRTISQQLFPDLIAWNFPGIGTPSLTLGGVSAEEVTAIIGHFSSGQQVGAKLSASDFYRRTGLQMANGPEDELKPIAQAAQPSPFGGGMGGGGGGLPFSEGGATGEFTEFWEAFAAGDVTWEPYTNPANGQSGAKSSGGRVLYGQAALQVLKGVGKVAAKGAVAAGRATVRTAVSAGKAAHSVATSVKDMVSRPMLKPKEIESIKSAAIAGGLHPEQAAKLDQLAGPTVKAAIAKAQTMSNPQARDQAIAAAVRGGLTPEKIAKVVEAAKAGGMSGRALTRLERATDPEYRQRIAKDAAEKAKEASLATKWHAENKERFGPTAANAMYAAHWVGRVVARPVIAFLTGGLSLVPGVSLTSKILTGQIVRKVVRTAANAIKWGVVKPIRAVTRQSEGGVDGDVDFDQFGDVDDMVATFQAQLAESTSSPEWSDDQIADVLNALSQIQLTDADVEEIESIDSAAVELATALDQAVEGVDPEMVDQIEDLALVVGDRDLAALRDGFAEAADPDAESTGEILEILDLNAQVAQDATAPEVAAPIPFRGETSTGDGSDWNVSDYSEPAEWDWGLSLAIG